MRSLRLAVSDLRILSGFLGLVLAGQSVAEDQWSGFQNSGRLIVSELPDAWDAQGKNVAWKDRKSVV